MIAHAGCAHYATEHEPWTKQLEDLGIATSALNAAHPQLGVSSYYATVEKEQVVFRAISRFHAAPISP